MPTRVSESTLEQFRQGAAGPQATPAGVAIAAVSASFALGLLAKVLTVTGRRRESSANLLRLETLTAAAQAASQHMLQLGADDSAAFDSYLAARRLPHSTEPERQTREQAINSSVRHAIHLPLAAAQEASAGLQLCSEMSALTPPALTADLGVAAALLASALRGFLLCAESNVRQLAPDAATYREHVAAESKRHERALRQAEAVLEHAETSLESAVVRRGES